MENNPRQDEPSTHEESSSEHGNESEINFNLFHVQQVISSIFTPYIEGPKMNWTVSDDLHHRFLKWRLKGKNILEYELATLVEKRKYKWVIAWSGDFGIDQYVSWNLSNEEPTLDVIWEKI